ncbi:hypothetical protein Taro_025917 [Colocasia esculenta]|uniref:Uncharacterized protein n=1 Tax=Colocasia esculenta TaxID=4460 RepID=A0A843VLY7_COLES|nr:hypothetical protein [Colocasia esculenta]
MYNLNQSGSDTNLCDDPPYTGTIIPIHVGIIRRDYTLPINVDDDEDDDDDDDPDPEFTAAARVSRRSYEEEDDRRRGLGTSGSHLSRDDSRRSLLRSTSVLEPQEVMGLGVSFQDMRIIQHHPINNKEAKGKHKNNMGDMKANKGKQGMIGDMGLLIYPFLVLQNCHIQISAMLVRLVTWAIFKLLGMIVSSLQNNQEKVQANKQRHLEASKEDSKTLSILYLALDIPSMEDMTPGALHAGPAALRAGPAALASLRATRAMLPLALVPLPNMDGRVGSGGWVGLSRSQP